MQIQENYSLGHLNTFNIEAKASYYFAANDIRSTQKLFKQQQETPYPMFILGGGSNILLLGDYAGLVVHNQFKGIEIVAEDEQHVYVEAYGGEEWHDLVLYTVDRGLWGIENLSLIPGSVGAAPIQNIGAYGVELMNVFVTAIAINTSTGRIAEFTLDDCAFAYRESIFKSELKGQYLIVSVTLRLNKEPRPRLGYGAITRELELAGITDPSVKQISDVICKIRRSKLPDPKELGNSGSFFKNVIVDKAKLEELQSEFENVPSYPVDDQRVKLPTGWLIEQCGWKGKKVGNTGAFANQALVLVNYGGASGEEIYRLSEDIKDSVYNHFGIEISREVTLV